MAPTCRKYRTGGGEIQIKSGGKCLAARNRDRAAIDAGKLAAAPDSISALNSSGFLRRLRRERLQAGLDLVHRPRFVLRSPFAVKAKIKLA